MKSIRVISLNPEDPSILRDFLRLYFRDADEEKDVDPDVVLNICSHERSIGIVLFYEGQEYVHTEEICSDVFVEEDINCYRRCLRLAVHKTLSRYLSLDLSPWGILTGVRPTKIVHRMQEQGLDSAQIASALSRAYGVDPQKAALLVEIVDGQHLLLSEIEERKETVSIYISIPFCPSRCYYCSFPAFSLKQWGHLLPQYLQALGLELEMAGSMLTEQGIQVRCVYIGGGTPTILTAQQLDVLLELIKSNFDLTEDCEITVEGGRPDTLDEEKLSVLKNHKIDRLSINPQTMSEDTLKLIGRRHTPEDVLQAFALARSTGISVINMDLIIGLPGEDIAIVKKSIREITALQPENVTLHALALKRASFYKQNGVQLLPSDEGRKILDSAAQSLRDAGYVPYYLYRQKNIFAHGENIGYSLPGFSCLYNVLMIEERQNILGFGVGSGSKVILDDKRIENIYNPKDVKVYLERLPEIIAKKGQVSWLRKKGVG